MLNHKAWKILTFFSLLPYKTLSPCCFIKMTWRNVSFSCGIRIGQQIWLGSLSTMSPWKGCVATVDSDTGVAGLNNDRSFPSSVGSKKRQCFFT